MKLPRPILWNISNWLRIDRELFVFEYAVAKRPCQNSGIFSSRGQRVVIIR